MGRFTTCHIYSRLIVMFLDKNTCNARSFFFSEGICRNFSVTISTVIYLSRYCLLTLPVVKVEKMSYKRCQDPILRPVGHPSVCLSVYCAHDGYPLDF
jgi:hypothetical protein